MKKLRSLLTILSGLGLGIALLIPIQTQAVKFKQYIKTYQGDWENTVDECGNTGETGTITVTLSKIKRTSGTRAKIKQATVYFSDGSYGGFPAKGKLFKKNNKLKLRLNYGTDSITDYYITGTITKQTLKGKYYHYSSTSGCNWSGTLNTTAL